MSLPTIIQLYRADQFYLWKKSEYPKKTTILPQVYTNVKSGLSDSLRICK